MFCLAERPEVLAMLRSEEYSAITADYDRIPSVSAGMMEVGASASWPKM